MLKWGIILIQICVLFDKLNKMDYSYIQKEIKDKISEIYKNMVGIILNFTIENKIKRFIDSILILNLPKKKYVMKKIILKKRIHFN